MSALSTIEVKYPEGLPLMSSGLIALGLALIAAGPKMKTSWLWFWNHSYEISLEMAIEDAILALAFLGASKYRAKCAIQNGSLR